MYGEDGYKTVELSIKNMHCDQCVERIKNALEAVDSIDYALVSVGGAKVRFQAYHVTREYIEEIIGNAGYTVGEAEGS